LLLERFLGKVRFSIPEASTGPYFRCPDGNYVRLPLVESHNQRPLKGDQKNA
jgi:hypothetical protein